MMFGAFLFQRAAPSPGPWCGRDALCRAWRWCHSEAGMLRHLLPRAIRRELADPTPNTSKPSCAVPHRKSACWRHWLSVRWPISSADRQRQTRQDRHQRWAAHL